MKTLTFTAQLSVALFLVPLGGSVALAQSPSAGAPTAVNTAFVKLFGTVGAFTAKVEAQVFDQHEKETMRMPMDFAVLDGKVRIDIDLAQAQGKDLPPSTVAGLKQVGMDRITSVFRPDKKATYVIYPGIQSYSNIPLAKGEAEATEKSYTLKKTALGKETIDGHACVKNKAVVKGDQGPVIEAVTWNAADLKGFPVQIELKEKQSTVRMRFTQVQFAKPEAKQFDAPANYGLMK
jgi:hypothetical protein